MGAPWWAWSILANLGISGIEYVNHAGGYGTWAVTLLRTGPLIVITQYSLYRAFSGTDHWLIAWAVFTIGNVVTRTAAVALLTPEQVTGWGAALAGIAIMVVGAMIVRNGLS